MSYRERLLKNKKYRDIRDKCFQLIEEEGMTRYQISKCTEIDQTRLSRVYHGKVPMSMNELIQICDACSLKLEIRKEGKLKENTRQMVDYFKNIFP